MKQLSALDAGFVFSESATCPQHIGSLSIFDPSTAPSGELRYDQVVDLIEKRGHMVPYLRQRLLEVPLNLDFPYWVNLESYDPKFHIRHIAIPAPGNWRQLCDALERIHARPLDRTKPLWELYFIEGLNDIEGLPKGCVAHYTKTHHSCIDGKLSSDIGAAFSDLTPVADESRIPAPGPWQVDRIPTDEELLARKDINNALMPFRYLETLKHSGKKLEKAIKDISDGKLQLPSKTPRTRFNGVVSSNRSFDGVQLDLATIRAIKNESGGTVNDVVLAICSGALRAYLLEKNELPEHSLVSLCPVNVRTGDTDPAAIESGNQVTPMGVALRTDIADPVERLLAIRDETFHAKELTRAIGAKTMMEFGQFTPSILASQGAKLAAEQGEANYKDPVFNTVTTNVPGPQFPLYSSGAKVLVNYGLGIAQDGVGLFHSIGSYCGNVTIGVLVCREMMPDVSHYADLLNQSFAELEQGFLNKKPSPAA